jgi:hypothetical protein
MKVAERGVFSGTNLGWRCRRLRPELLPIFPTTILRSMDDGDNAFTRRTAYQS